MRNKTAGSRGSLKTRGRYHDAPGGKRTTNGGVADGGDDEDKGERKVCGSSAAKICGSLDFGWGEREGVDEAIRFN